MDALYEVLENVKRVPLMPAVTPLHRMERLEKLWNYDGIYIKRDDMTGIGTGGNKIRSLEFILGDALEKRSDKILVSGPGQSNLCMLTAAACAKLGLGCEVIHNCEKPGKPEGNLLLNHILGVKSHFLGNVDSAVRNAYMENLAKQEEARGHKPYVVRNGATTGMGALGYVAAVPELKKQCEEAGIDGLTIFAPGGNGGVATGLIYGNALLGMPFQIVIVSVEDDRKTLTAHIQVTLHELEEITGVRMPQSFETACSILEDFRGDGWGVNTEESAAAVFEFARQEGIFIENVYNSKVLTGMKKLAEKGAVKGNICYLHTGGIGSLFAQY